MPAQQNDVGSVCINATKMLAGSNLRAECMERAGMSSLILVFTDLLERVAMLAAQHRTGLGQGAGRGTETL
jgi:hypothetical protein